MAEPTAVSLRPHHDYKSWSTDWYGPDRDASGRLRRHYKRFGRAGDLTAKAARALYNRWVEEEWRPKYGSGATSTLLTAPAYTVADLCDDYREHAKSFYVKAGEPTSQMQTVKLATRRFSGMFGPLAPSGVRAPMLAQFRDELLKPNRKGRDEALTVDTASHYLKCVKRMMRWAAEKGHIDEDRAGGLMLVGGLKRGRCAARSTEPVKPVAWADVAAVVAVLPANVGAMVLLQWHTGMRPGEVRMVRPCDVNTSGPVWVYTPRTHKMEHKGKSRRVHIGPEGQKVLRPYLARRTDAYCFTPTESGDKLPKLRKAPMFGMIQYRDILVRAAGNANVPPFHPNRLRHSWATRVAEAEGIEAAQDGLGHSSINTTLIYAERSDKRAASVALKVG